MFSPENQPSSKLSPLTLFFASTHTAHSSVDHHRSDPVFATASNLVQIWDETKSAPISNLTFPTSTETITGVRFNLSESSVLASIGSDRTFTLYDIRTGKAERRVVMQVNSQIGNPEKLLFIYSFITDAEQFISMVTYLPYLNPPCFRRPQSLHIRHPAPIHTQPNIQSPRRRRHELRLEPNWP